MATNETSQRPEGSSPAASAPQLVPAGAVEVLPPPDDPRATAQHVALVGLFVLAAVYTLYFARAFFVPIVLAILIDFVLSPVIRWLKRFRIPAPAGAGLMVALLVGVVSLSVYTLSEPAAEWIARAPQSIERARVKLDVVRKPVEQMTQAAQKMERATDVSGDRTQKVEIKGPSLIRQLFGGTTALLGAATIVVFLAYFLLAAGDLFLQKLVAVLPQFQDKRKAVQIAREVEAQISVYLFTTVLVNIGVGVVTGVVLYFLGMPNPVLWGVVAGVLNFIPYVGALINIVVLALAALLSFETVGRALVIPGAFLFLNLIESNLVTPMILGRRMQLNAVAVFVGLVFWWYLWGVTGAIMAVPLVAILKIMGDHIESLAPIGEFLGEKR